MSLKRLIIGVAAMLLASAGAGAAQLTSETPLALPQYGHAPGDQVNPIAASNGTGFLVAWIDHRGPVSIVANRVTQSGEVLDGTGIRIPTDVGDPAATPGKLLGLFHVDGAYTLIYKTGTTASPPPFPLTTQAVIISDDGQVLDGPRPILDHVARVVASNGSRILVVSDKDVIVLNGRAAVVKRPQWPGMPGAYGAGLASNGSAFLLANFVYDGVANSVNLIAFDADGETTNTTRIHSSGVGDAPIVQSDGAGFLVVFNNGATGPTIVSANAHAEILSTSTRTFTQSTNFAALAWTGLKYLLASLTADGKQQIAIMELDRDGTTTGSGKSLEGATSSATDNPAIAKNDRGDSLVAWTSGSWQDTDGLEIHAALLDPDGTPRLPVLTVPTGNTAQHFPVMATGGAYDLAVWQEASGIYATRVTSGGVALDGRGLLVYPRTTGNSDQPPQVIFDGTAYLVAWGTKGQRIDPATGTRIGAAIPLPACATSFDLGYDGTSAIIFFVDACSWQVSAQRVGPAGVTGSAVPISPEYVQTGPPHAAWNGHEWLVAWTKRLPTVVELFTLGNVYAARLSGSLTLLDPQPIAIAVSPFDEEYPLVASDGHDFVVLWTHNFSPAGLYVRHVHADGTAGEAASLLPLPFPDVAMAWDGIRFAVSYKRPCALPCQSRAYLSHFDVRDDQPVLSDTVPIGDSDLDDLSLTGLSNGRLHIAYRRYALDAPYDGTARVFFRDSVFGGTPRRRAAGGR